MQLVREAERRHADVEAGVLPKCSSFTLEPKRRQCSIVCSALSVAGEKEMRMDQEICGHERAIAMTTYADSVWIRYTQRHGFVDGGLGAGHQLLHVSVIRGHLRPNDRNRGILEDRIPFECQQNVLRT